MGLKLDSLDDRTRVLMMREIELDAASNRLYISTRLNGRGQTEYPTLLRRAVSHETDDWLADQLRSNRLLNPVLQRRKPKGGYTTARMPENAPDTRRGRA